MSFPNVAPSEVPEGREVTMGTMLIVDWVVFPFYPIQVVGARHKILGRCYLHGTYRIKVALTDEPLKKEMHHSRSTRKAMNQWSGLGSILSLFLGKVRKKAMSQCVHVEGVLTDLGVTRAFPPSH